MSKRLHGWKSIAAHFGRDRSTVMRWARERNLPVRRYPGGKKGSVYADVDELDAWIAAASEESDEAVAEREDAGPGVGPDRPESGSGDAQRSHRWIVPAIAALFVLVVCGAWYATRTSAESSATVELPQQPELASLYLSARDDWAARTAAGLNRSITKLQTVTRRDPGFAPAFAALADAYLLAGEFGTIAYDSAMRKAQQATDTALSIQPDLPEALRARGFIAYWWDRDPVASGTAFRRALDLQSNNAQTHFWYGNVLSDNGDHKAALRELNRARLLQPGSQAIQTDLGWALWCAGQDDKALAILEERLRGPDPSAVVHDSLSHIYLARGDVAAFSRHLTAYATLRGEDQKKAYAARVAEAVPRGRSAVLVVALQQAMEEVANGLSPDRSWAAFVASLSNDRTRLVSILHAAESRQELWGASGFTSRIARQWQGDTEISGLLKARLSAPME